MKFVWFIFCVFLQVAPYRIHRNNDQGFISAQVVLVYFCGLALNSAVSIICGPFIVGDVCDDCPVCHLGDE